MKNPVVKNPVVKNPVVKNPVVKTPVVEDPVVKNPVVKTPVVEDPVVKDLIVRIAGVPDTDLVTAHFAASAMKSSTWRRRHYGQGRIMLSGISYSPFVFSPPNRMFSLV